MSDNDVTEGSGTPSSRKQLRMFDLVLFSVCAMLLLSQLTVSAQIGATSIFWTVVLMILFFAPYSLITAELGSTYPDAGGLYSWIVRAFGSRWGTRVSWWYWLNVGLWVPSVYLMLSGVVSSLFFDGKLGFWWQIAIALVFIWINYWVNSRSIETGAWVSNLGAAVTVAVIIVLSIGGWIYTARHGSVTEWSLDTIVPHKGMSALALALPVIIYNFLGFELMSSASKDMENPKRDVPKAILFAGVLIGGFYLLATVGMLQVLGADTISATTGLMDAIRVAFGESGAGRFVEIAVGIGAVYCFFASLIPWTIGANLAAAESAAEGDLPPVFGKLHPERQTPIGAAFLCSLVSTIIIVAYGVLFQLTNGAVDDLFWSLFAFSSVIFLLPYVLMLPAFLKLRREDPDAERPYRIPGGNRVAIVVTLIPTLLLILAAFFFIVNPFDLDLTATLSILGGLLVTGAIQEYFVYQASSRKADPVQRADALSAEGNA